MKCMYNQSKRGLPSDVRTMAKPWAKNVKFCPSDKFADEKGNWNNDRASNVRGVLSDMANAVFERKSLLSPTIDPESLRPKAHWISDSGACFAAQAPIVPTSRTAMTAAVTGSRKSLPHNPRRIRRA